MTKEQKREYGRQYYQKNRERILTRMREYVQERKADPVRYAKWLQDHLSYQAKYKKQNTEKVRKRQREYYLRLKQDPVKFKQYQIYQCRWWREYRRRKKHQPLPRIEEVQVLDKRAVGEYKE